MGSVYVSEHTQSQLTDYFDFEDLGPQDVKGKAEKVRVFKAVGERDVRSRMDASIARLPSLLFGSYSPGGPISTIGLARLSGRCGGGARNSDIVPIITTPIATRNVFG